LSNSDYETPPGQKPTLNSYLLWVARERNLPGVNLWVPVPYYFVPLNDPRACMRLADFFNLRFNLGLEFHNLSAEMDSQDQRIHKLFAQSPEIEGYVRKLEIGEALNTEESEKLAQSMAEYLKGIS